MILAGTAAILEPLLNFLTEKKNHYNVISTVFIVIIYFDIYEFIESSHSCESINKCLSS